MLVKLKFSFNLNDNGLRKTYKGYILRGHVEFESHLDVQLSFDISQFQSNSICGMERWKN